MAWYIHVENETNDGFRGPTVPHIEGSLREAFNSQIGQRKASENGMKMGERDTSKSEEEMDKWDTSKNEKKIGKWGASVENDKRTERIKECKDWSERREEWSKGCTEWHKRNKEWKVCNERCKEWADEWANRCNERTKNENKWAFREFCTPFWYLKASLMVHCVFTYSNADTGWTVDNDVKSCSGLYRILLA